MNTKTYLAAITVIAGLIAGATASEAREPRTTPQQQAFLGIHGETTAPIGWRQFCRENASECRSEPRTPLDAAMTRARWAELNQVNRQVNAAIAPATDQEIYGVLERWTYPTNGRGDCEDYALLKRRMLMERGWPESALLMTVVRDRRGDGHAVLMVRTSEGDVVLDNVVDEILPWAQTGYRFVKRQSQWAPNIWVSLPDDIGRADQAVASRR